MSAPEPGPSALAEDSRQLAVLNRDQISIYSIAGKVWTKVDPQHHSEEVS